MQGPAAGAPQAPAQAPPEAILVQPPAPPPPRPTRAPGGVGISRAFCIIVGVFALLWAVFMAIRLPMVLKAREIVRVDPETKFLVGYSGVLVVGLSIATGLICLGSAGRLGRPGGGSRAVGLGAAVVCCASVWCGLVYPLCLGLGIACLAVLLGRRASAWLDYGGVCPPGSAVVVAAVRRIVSWLVILSIPIWVLAFVTDDPKLPVFYRWLGLGPFLHRRSPLRLSYAVTVGLDVAIAFVWLFVARGLVRVRRWSRPTGIALLGVSVLMQWIGVLLAFQLGRMMRRPGTLLPTWLLVEAALGTAVNAGLIALLVRPSVGRAFAKASPAPAAAP